MDNPGDGRLFVAWRQALLTRPADARARAVEAFALAHGRLDEIFPDNDTTPLVSACVADLPDCARLLLALGASPDAPDGIGWTPLHWCAQSSRVQCAEELLAAGADPEPRSARERALPMHFSALSGCVEVAALLASRGADPSAIDPDTHAGAAHWAAHDLKWQKAAGSPTPRPDGLGRTQLHWAARQASSDEQAERACRHWLALGCDPAIADARGKLPEEEASARGHMQCSAMLRAARERGCIGAAVAPSDHGCEARSGRL